MVRIFGQLNSPIDGQPLTNTTIELKSLETSSQVLNGVSTTKTSLNDASYDMEVPVGFYELSLIEEGKRKQPVGKFRVYNDSNPSDLNGFLTQPQSELKPEWILFIESETQKAQTASTNASNDATQTALDRAQTTSDAAQTVLDRVQTTADAGSTSSDAIATADDVVKTNADVVKTNADVVKTNADVLAALGHKNDAAGSAAAAEQAFDHFDDRYLGAKATPPALDNDGNVLQVGATYWHSTEQFLYYWNGAVWEAPDKAASVSAANSATSASNSLASEGASAGSAAAAELSRTQSATNAQSTADDLAASQQVKADVTALKADTTSLKAAAETASTNAGDSATAAGLSEGKSKTSEDNAKASENAAAASAIAISSGAYARTLADRAAMRKQNDERYAASGMVHAGKHYDNGVNQFNVNEGLYTVQSIANKLAIGRNDDKESASKTKFTITNIAGIISKLINSSTGGRAYNLDWEPAPRGTISFDSATGVQIDHETYVDPKYGNAPSGTALQIQNEAVARAFEGDVKNGDFRLGNDGSWFSGDNSRGNIGFSNGQLVITDTNNDSLGAYARNNFDMVAGVEYEFIVSIDSLTTSETIVNFVRDPDGSGFYPVEATSVKGVYSTRFTASTTGTGYVALYAQANLGVATYNSISIRPVTNEVQTEAVDVGFFEHFLQEITPAKPWVYLNGAIQSLATTMDGLATVDDDRPDSYHAVYTGDTASGKKARNWFTMSVLERDIHLANPDNNIWYDKENDTWVQDVYRWRVVRGAGNGDWANVDPALELTSLSLEQRFKWAEDSVTNPNTSKVVRAQGIKDSVTAYVEDNSYTENYITYAESMDNIGGAVGVFASPFSTVGYNGECYAYVVCVIPRANQGGYHPSFNPKGTAKYWNVNSIGNTTATTFWYNTLSPDVNTAADCFNEATHKCTGTGDISDGRSGHPDGLHHDALYASGLNGVIDKRLSAWDKSDMKDAPRIDDGEWRGEEKLVRTTPEIQTANNSAGSGNIYLDNYASYSVGDTVYSQPSGVGDYNEGVVQSVNNGYLTVSPATGRTENGVILITSKTNTTVEGEFATMDVAADPVGVLATPDLAQGWDGGWINVIPDGTTVDMPLTRKSISGTPDQVASTDGGVTWTTGVVGGWNDATNAAEGRSYGAGVILVWNYKAKARITEPATDLTVFNNAVGLGDVIITSDYRPEHGCLLAESVIGEILKSSPSVGQISIESARPIKYLINTELERLTHALTDLDAPTNNSKAVKIAVYQVIKNGQMFVGFVANTMSHNGTDWGDTGEVFIPDDASTATFPDSNGVTQTATVSITNKSHGWAKNNV